MGALSGKVIIAIIAWISVVVILTIVIPIIGVYSERESTTTTLTLTTTTAESTSDTNNGGGTVLAEFRCFCEGISQSPSQSAPTILVLKTRVRL